MFNFFKKKKTVLQEPKTIKNEDYNDVTDIAKYFKNETGVTFDQQITVLKNKVTTFCKHREIESFSKAELNINIFATGSTYTAMQYLVNSPVLSTLKYPDSNKIPKLFPK